MISVKIISVPSSLENLETKGPQIVARITERMNLLMLKLSSKVIGESIPELFPKGAPNIAATVRTIPAETIGTVIHGEVQAGGPKTTKRTLRSGVEVDYSGVQEYGISHSYVILPFNKKALRFLLDGKQMIRREVTHPGLKARPFMRSTLASMSDQIVAELQQELSEILKT